MEGVFGGGVVVGVRHGSSDVFYRGEGCVCMVL